MVCSHGHGKTNRYTHTHTHTHNTHAYTYTHTHTHTLFGKQFQETGRVLGLKTWVQSTSLASDCMHPSIPGSIIARFVLVALSMVSDKWLQVQGCPYKWQNGKTAITRKHKIGLQKSLKNLIILTRLFSVCLKVKKNSRCAIFSNSD